MFMQDRGKLLLIQKLIKIKVQTSIPRMEDRLGQRVFEDRPRSETTPRFSDIYAQ